MWDVPISDRISLWGRLSVPCYVLVCILFPARLFFCVVFCGYHDSNTSALAPLAPSRLRTHLFVFHEKFLCAQCVIRIVIRTFSRRSFARSAQSLSSCPHEWEKRKKANNEVVPDRTAVAPTNRPRATRFLRASGRPKWVWPRGSWCAKVTLQISERDLTPKGGSKKI